MKEFHRDPNFASLITSIPEEEVIGTRDELLNYLLILNRTYWNNTFSSDIFDYEKLIYIKKAYPNDYEIQNLIEIIEENIAKNYKLKQQYIARLTDNIKNPNINNIHDVFGYLTFNLNESVYNTERGFLNAYREDEPIV